MSEGRYKLEDFELYRAAREFRKGVYRVIKCLPPSERYCLDPQNAPGGGFHYEQHRGGAWTVARAREYAVLSDRARID